MIEKYLLLCFFSILYKKVRIIFGCLEYGFLVFFRISEFIDMFCVDFVWNEEEIKIVEIKEEIILII